MANLPKISIITPTYNSGESIELCILSVANQTYKNIEHLIIDGQSSDKTLGIVKNYAERFSHLRVISERDNGIYDAMNKGIDLAQGEWIYFLGSDDIFYDEHVLEDLFSKEDLKNYDLIYGNTKFRISGKIYDGEFSPLKLIEKNICHQAIFHRKKLFELFGKYETKYKGVADWVFNVKWFNSQKIKYQFIDRIVAEYNEDGYAFNNPDNEFTKDREKIIRQEFPSEVVSIYFKKYDLDESKIRTIAFYLPQFHTIPENDQWWGKGFTEWTNVKKAKPLFEGHYQPHVPHEDIGYYDLRDVEVQKKQAEMAREYGLFGFCYYHYWFAGKKLLDNPLKNMLRHPEIELPFCVCWANENWTRQWDGAKDEILIAQHHSDEDDLNFILDMIPVLEDKRYITVQGKPLLIIYRPKLFPDPKRTMEIWREEVRKHGFPGLYIARVENFDKRIDPQEFGCDAAIDFAPDWDALGKPLREGNPATLSYDSMIENDLLKDRDYEFFRCVCPIWDNAPRRQDGGGVTFIDSSPEKYKYWLKNSIKQTLKKSKDPDKRMVFINAWNEWGEGAYLEPSKRYGYAYLDATKNAISEAEIEFKNGIMFDQFVIERFRNSKTQLEGKIQREEFLTGQVHEKDQASQSVKAQLEAENKKAGFLTLQVYEKDQAIQSLTTQLGLITNSLGWISLQEARKFRLWLAPLGSRRNRFLQLVFRALPIWRREGLQSLLGKANRKIRPSRVEDSSLITQSGGADVVPTPEVEIDSDFNLFEHPENYGFVSIIIVSYNSLNHIKMCMDSILLKTHYPRYEVVVVDNGSTKDVVDYLQSLQSDPRIRVILNPENMGFARANNIGLQAISPESEYIVLLNNDTIVTRGWLGGLVHWLQDPAIGLVGPVTCPSGATNEAAIPADYNDLTEMEPFAQKVTNRKRGVCFDIPMLTMFCVALRRNLYEEIGPLDEQFEVGMFEDDDYAVRVRNKGYRIICAEDVFIHHFGRTSFSVLQDEEHRRIFDENRRRFETKWNTQWKFPQARQINLEVLWFLADRSRWFVTAELSLGQAYRKSDQESEIFLINLNKRKDIQSEGLGTDKETITECGHQMGFLFTYPNFANFERVFSESNESISSSGPNATAVSKQISRLLYQAYKYHYKQLPDSDQKLAALPEETNNISFRIDRFFQSDGFVELEGWAYIDGGDCENAEIFIVFKSEKKTYLFEAMPVKRPDVTRYFKTFNFEDSGFLANIPKKRISKETYKVGLYIRKNKVEALQFVTTWNNGSGESPIIKP